MEDLSYSFTTDLWVWLSPKKATAWHFITVPQDDADHMRFFSAHLTRGFKSLRVRARIGDTEWKTSIFPSTERGSYILPVKKSVRQSENIGEGDPVKVFLKILD